jgi:hypothetical protein
LHATDCQKNCFNLSVNHLNYWLLEWLIFWFYDAWV